MMVQHSVIFYVLIPTIVIREIEEQERNWQEKAESRSAGSSPTTDEENIRGK
jgi:hypothetical protein